LYFGGKSGNKSLARFSATKRLQLSPSHASFFARNVGIGVGAVVVDDMSGLLLRVAQPSADESQGPQLAKLLPVRDDRADDGHCPLDAVDRHHVPQR
jgi:hypothetical protein